MKATKLHEIDDRAGGEPTRAGRGWEPDLAWYWDDRIGDLGVHAAAYDPRTSGGDPMRLQGPERGLGAATRARTIEGHLAGVTTAQRNVLWMAHAPIHRCLRAWRLANVPEALKGSGEHAAAYKVEAVKGFWTPLGALAPIVLALHPGEAVEVLEVLATKGVEKAVRERAEASIREWRVEAEAAIVEAVTAYRAARRKAGRMERAARKQRKEDRARALFKVPA